MRAKFISERVELEFSAKEFDLIDASLSYVLWIVGIFGDDFYRQFGVKREDAEVFTESLGAAEIAARSRGDHWRPPRPQASSSEVGASLDAEFSVGGAKLKVSESDFRFIRGAIAFVVDESTMSDNDFVCILAAPRSDGQLLLHGLQHDDH